MNSFNKNSYGRSIDFFADSVNDYIKSRNADGKKRFKLVKKGFKVIAI